jgi:hypothetical protein
MMVSFSKWQGDRFAFNCTLLNSNETAVRNLRFTTYAIFYKIQADRPEEYAEREEFYTLD